MQTLDAAASLPASTLIDELIEALSPPHEIIEVSLGMRKFTFRAIIDRSELLRLRRAAARFAELSPEQVLHLAERPFFDTDAETKALAFVLAETSLEPKLRPVDLLRLAKRAGLAFEQLKEAVNCGHQRGLEFAETQAVLTAKNDSGGTPSGGFA